MQTDGGDPRIIKQRINHLAKVALGLVARGDQIGDRQAARLHRQIKPYIARLRDNGDAALNRQAAMLVRPKRCAIQIVQQAVTIRTQQSEIARNRHQLRLKGRALGAYFGKTRGVTHRPARPHFGECSHRLNGRLARHSDKGGIRHAGQFGQRCIGLTTGNLGPLGVNRPDIARKADTLALADYFGGFPSTHHDEGTGRQQAGKVGAAHKGHFLKRRLDIISLLSSRAGKSDASEATMMRLKATRGQASLRRSNTCRNVSIIHHGRATDRLNA